MRHIFKVVGNIYSEGIRIIKSIRTLHANRVILKYGRYSDMARVTYAQLGEDLIISDYLIRLCKIKGMEKYSYLDVGANDPVRMSNTYLTYKMEGNRCSCGA